MSTTNPTLMQRLIAYNVLQSATPPSVPPTPVPVPPPPKTLEQRVADLEKWRQTLEAGK